MVRSGGGGGSMHSSRYSADDSSQSGLSDSESTRSEPVGSTRYKKGQTTNYAKMYYPGRSGSSERLHPEHALLSGSGAPLSGSRSEQYLATGIVQDRERLPTTPTMKKRVARRGRLSNLLVGRNLMKFMWLQYEIQKRRQQLEETARLKKELLKLARARQAIAHSYDDIPRQYGPPSHADRGSVGNLNMPPRPVPRGIIRPIDDDIRMAELAERERERELERLERAYMERDDIDVIYDVLPARRGHQPPPERDRPVVGERSVAGGGVAMPYQSRSNYSSTEYLVHKQQETARRQRPDEPLYVNTAPGWMYGTDLMGVGVPESQSLSQPVLTKRIDSLPSVAPGVPSRDGKLSSSVTLPDIYSNRCDLDFRPPHPVHASLSSSSHTYVNTSISDTDGSPTSVSDVTPAMPLLDDVKDKSRKIIHNIGSGSRPVSAEFNIGDVEDLMNGMYRVESDNSVDADEPIMKHMMEGGVTILKQMERKRRPPPVEPTRYNFPVKRILVTRDPKDRSLYFPWVVPSTGNGIGMKIVGGKEISGTSETGAFVTAIYPGLIADQLHGELEVGDQVLEWNGIKLTGKTYEEVQQIITQTNGEIELVVRAQSSSVSEETNVKQVESCHSSYDNLPAYEEVVKDLRATSSSRQGVDPRLLAAQLEEIQEAASPAEQSPSSSQQGPPTPSMSSPCSTPRSDPTSTSSDKQRPSGGRHTPDRRDRDRIDRRGGSSGGSSGGTEKHHRRSTRHHRDSERERERDSERGERDRSERDFNDARDRDRGEREELFVGERQRHAHRATSRTGGARQRQTTSRQRP
ncbi:hypothetical protein C0Q70_15626 [Pomacea canaliculata]|uniref:PDZ domain-containing protein n=1 Tax=Pomacea canaliculata TaxID=400727 RepID=A0A2T7NVC4_POMCA|nr:hypothetical protein C0Q70_15626 [Pomacea canaliculata]